MDRLLVVVILFYCGIPLLVKSTLSQPKPVVKPLYYSQQQIRFIENRIENSGVTTVLVQPENFNYSLSIGDPVYINPEKKHSENTGDLAKRIREESKLIQLICLREAAGACVATLLLYPKLQKKVTQIVTVEADIKTFKKPSVVKIEPLAASLNPLSGLVDTWKLVQSKFREQSLRRKTESESAFDPAELIRLKMRVRVRWVDQSPDAGSQIHFGAPLN